MREGGKGNPSLAAKKNSNQNEKRISLERKRKTRKLKRTSIVPFKLKAAI